MLPHIKLPMLPIVGSDALHPDVLQQEELLLLCVLRDQDREVLTDVLRTTWREFAGTLAVWLLDETALAEATDCFAIIGTPTFLLLHRGIELERHLGRADAPTLAAFIRRHAPFSRSTPP